MKNLKVVIVFIVGIILVSSISVYATATYLYNATDVGYNNTNVSSALDDLYSKLPIKENVIITETKTGINVSNAKTIDTSNLYSKSGSGDNVFYKSGSVNLDSNGYGVINNIGFTPSAIICIHEKTNERAYAYIKRNSGGNYFGTNGGIR